MRIGLLTFEYPSEGHTGGIGAYCAGMAAGLRELGHEVAILLVTPGDGARSYEGAVVERIRPAESRVPFPVRGSGFILARRIAHAARKLRLDVLESPEFGGMTAFLNLFRPKRLGVVVRLHTSRMINRHFFSDLHQGSRARLQHAKEDWAEARAMRTADALTAVSCAVVDATSKHLALRRPVAVFPSPVRRMFFEAQGERDGNMVLVVGRLEFIKGTDRIIAALPALLRAHPTAELVLVGSDTNTAPGGESMLRWAAASLPADCRTHLSHVPAVCPEQLVSFYERAAVCVAPSRWEGLPVAVQEAMAAGKPVVGSDAAGIRELLLDDCGICVPGDDTDFMVAAIARLLKDDELRTRMGNSARAHARTEFDPLVIGRKALAVYHSVWRH